MPRHHKHSKYSDASSNSDSSSDDDEIYDTRPSAAAVKRSRMDEKDATTIAKKVFGDDSDADDSESDNGLYTSIAKEITRIFNSCRIAYAKEINRLIEQLNPENPHDVLVLKKLASTNHESWITLTQPLIQAKLDSIIAGHKVATSPDPNSDAEYEDDDPTAQPTIIIGKASDTE